jgi:hypothetical protein
MDDILITGANDFDHLSNLKTVLQRLSSFGLKANKEKSRFMQPELLYLGHLINKKGVQVSPDKIQPIIDAPRPRNVGELRSWLGMINYYSNFIPDLATVESPLNMLLRNGCKWAWEQPQEDSWMALKSALTSTSLLVHYSSTLQIKLECDASPVGVGAIISHVMENGTTRPIAFGSRTLSTAERNYPQIEREALAIIFGITKFHQYLYGRKFTLVTDCKPLTTIFGAQTAIPTLAALRMQRWAMKLMAYNYDIEFRSTKQHCNVDALSRLPLFTPDKEEYIQSIQLSDMPVHCKDIWQETRRDPLLSKVLHFTRCGWPSSKSLSLAFTPFYERRLELSIEQDCLLWGTRVVIPKKLRNQVLDEIHSTHVGICKMKSLARQHVWWPAIDVNIETVVRSCTPCQQLQPTMPLVPMHPMVWPEKSWQRVHIDYAGPFKGNMFLVCIDAHSKWPEVVKTNDTSSRGTIKKLMEIFSRWGLPEQLVSDNGPQFCSEEFKQFLKANGIKHVRSSPYHPRSNGLAERMVRTFKNAMKAALHESTLDMSIMLSKFLLKYRTTPHSTTQTPPSELLMGKRLRTRLDLMHPDLRKSVTSKQTDQETIFNKGSVLAREFELGQSVWCETFKQGNKWQLGKITKCTGPSSYEIDIGNGKIVRRHADSIRLAYSSETSTSLNAQDFIGEDPAIGQAAASRSQRTRKPPKRFILGEL